MKPLHDEFVTREQVALQPKTVLAYRRQVTVVRATLRGVMDYEDELEDEDRESVAISDACRAADLYDVQ